MNRDEVLAKSRLENAQLDERELQISFKACQISRAFGFALCLLVNFVASIAMGHENVISNACWTIYAGMYAIEYWVRAFRLKKKYDWFGMIFWTVCFVFFTFFFMLKLCR